MKDTASRVAEWLGLACDLMGEHLVELPAALVAETLRRTFDLEASTYSWSDADGRQQLTTWPDDVLLPVDDLDDWTTGESRCEHPLIRWYLASGDPRPWTIGRVPSSLVPVRDRSRLLASLRPVRLDQQLSIPFRLSGHAQHTFVLGRATTDFSDDDLLVARAAQRTLMGLDRHVGLLRELAPLERVAWDVGLTGRETTVLGLVVAGCSTRSAARTLGCSPRTVEKHLERVYRKLGVRDRVNAVRVARRWAIVPG